ncbi:hypothetical protein FANTH_1005 [Fusarium anthophilum]|uniref:Uncharacterized protein n=1 Tax=Fusarium anthophilum TaxID=48485 RepID=A0A8H4ZWJ3_9HYPO|nr:hypothetical protein FANTH_1005 [Fusarium anthophilum]
MDSISQLSQHLPPFVVNLSKSQRAQTIATVVGVLALLSPLNRWLSWRSANHGDTINRWNPATELVVVTGGSSGIGAKIVQMLEAKNIKVIILDINPPSGKSVGIGARTPFYKVDLSDADAIAAVAERIRSDHGHPTALVNNAGIAHGETILSVTPEKLHRLVSVNLEAPFLLTQQFLPNMITHNHGHIVNIASLASFLTQAANVDYGATKVGLLAFHEGLKQELRHIYNAPGVRATVLHPTWVNTPMIEPILKAGTLGRYVEAEDVAGAVVRQLLSGSILSDMSSTEAINKFVEGYAQLFKNGQRSPILRRPDEYGMKYEDIFFPSLDGTILQGWFIPAQNSQKLIIANHPMTCNRYGYPGHLEPYGGFGGFEVNFLPDYKSLHDAGYNIICYDLRNHGISDTGSGGMCGALGYYEARDVVGSIKYALSRPETKNNSIGLLSRCMGGNATIHAMTLFPEYFKSIKAMILLQAVSGHAFVEKGAINSGLDKEATVAAFDKRIYELTGFRLKELTPLPLAKNVTVPTLFAQVRKDFLIDTSDSQQIFDALGSKEKKMVWIEDTDRRFDGYNYFAKEPAEMLNWFEQYV